ncbi:MAG: hypothetical protein C1942_04805 [Prosthecochloris sp.]|nr:hypothetical protein [Prosthecochloris sp.]
MTSDEGRFAQEKRQRRLEIGFRSVLLLSADYTDGHRLKKRQLFSMKICVICGQTELFFSPFTIHHSPFTIHHSPFTIHQSPLIYVFSYTGKADCDQPGAWIENGIC